MNAIDSIRDEWAVRRIDTGWVGYAWNNETEVRATLATLDSFGDETRSRYRIVHRQVITTSWEEA